MSLLFIVLEMVMGFGFVILFGFFFYCLMKGDFRLNPNHTYAEAQVHDYVVVAKWNGYRRDGSGAGFFHEACANAYLAEMVGDDPLFEVYPTEKNVSHHCQWCEDMPCELCE
jgi:hypothetical protein